MSVDPQITDLMARLTELGIKNSFSAINSKIQVIKTKRDQNAAIQELEEIVNDLINDRSELLGIARTFEQEFVAQKISEKDIEYITTKFIPVLKDLMKQAPDANNVVGATDLEKTLDNLSALLSVEMLTVLQLVGFNFKKAIGEPLTQLLQKVIMTQAPADPQSSLEYNQLVVTHNIEALKVVQDKDASERLEQLRSKGIL